MTLCRAVTLFSNVNVGITRAQVQGKFTPKWDYAFGSWKDISVKQLFIYWVYAGSLIKYDDRGAFEFGVSLVWADSQSVETIRRDSCIESTLANYWSAR